LQGTGAGVWRTIGMRFEATSEMEMCGWVGCAAKRRILIDDVVS
jgi:hypothetical protein